MGPLALLALPAHYLLFVCFFVPYPVIIFISICFLSKMPGGVLVWGVVDAFDATVVLFCIEKNDKKKSAFFFSKNV